MTAKESEPKRTIETDASANCMRLLRAAWRKDRDTFDRAIHDYVKRGAIALEPRKPAGKGKEVLDVNLQLLLADVMVAKSRNVPEREKVRELAARGVRWSNPVVGGRRWLNENTIRTHLREARRRAAADEEFRDTVDFFAWALDRLD